ncbi:regucalcin family protein [Catenovulum agarivorans DS-2]|uniref:Regucalcin family protein n=1 Tax=Catenovulum agarivorans DS-2 TaxID=1328313 RepID=W7QLK1_9ALTE|nr:SMP-30/gluconolactonase/LRE family protein [Catenovulum agarivorans]EWH09817.1 regucalcin family protein [Catenovulum agarivorans DS-2]
MPIKITQLTNTNDLLGECPIYDKQTNKLLWVDILNHRWHQLDLATNNINTVQFKQGLTAFARLNDKSFYAAFEQEIALIDITGNIVKQLPETQLNNPDIRYNDGGLTPNGHFIVGTMDKKEQTPLGNCYLIDQHGNKTHMYHGITVFNTAIFSKRGDVFYSADSPKNTFVARTFLNPDTNSNQTQTASMSEPIAEFNIDPNIPGLPDGSCWHDDTSFWNARWDGSGLARINTQGQLLDFIELEVARPTHCCWINHELIVTTAAIGLSQTQLDAQPLSGSVLKITGLK